MTARPILGALGDLTPLWLMVRCSCGRSAALPCRLLARRHGTATRIDHLVPRLRCQKCKAAPAEAQLVDSPQEGASGFATGF